MTSQCESAAAELLRQCLNSEPWDAELARALAAPECADALFRVLVEGLADRFEPRLCADYASIFSFVLERVAPELHAEELVARYERVRAPRVCEIEPKHIAVLSRVTLGADIAVSSVILESLKRRFPSARIYLAGSAKAAELFARDARIEHIEAPYPRTGTLRDRLDCWNLLRRILPAEDTIVVDPDSRMTQLGLLPVCDDARYFFFESRAFGGSSEQSLGDLAAEWASQTFGVGAVQPSIAPMWADFAMRRRCVTVSLGTGGNAAKSLPESFEAGMIRFFCDRYDQVVVDRGFGADEAARVERATAGTKAESFEGSFGSFASLIAESDFYVGYDSAGQHAAAALEIPLVTLFKGFVSDRMFARWQPTGPASKRVLKIDEGMQSAEIMAWLETSFSQTA